MSAAHGLRRYETLVVFHPDLAQAGLEATLESIKSSIAASGGTEVEASEWGMRALAYPIRKQTRGFFEVFYYCGTGETVKELERSLRLNDAVLRVISAKRGEMDVRAAHGGERGEEAGSGRSEHDDEVTESEEDGQAIETE